MQKDPETGFFRYWSLITSSLANEKVQCHRSAYVNMYWGWVWGPGWPVPGWVKKQTLALTDLMLCSEMSCPWFHPSLLSFSPAPPLMQAPGPHFQLMAQHFGNIKLFISNTKPSHSYPTKQIHTFLFLQMATSSLQSPQLKNLVCSLIPFSSLPTSCSANSFASLPFPLRSLAVVSPLHCYRESGPRPSPVPLMQSLLGASPPGMRPSSTLISLDSPSPTSALLIGLGKSLLHPDLVIYCQSAFIFPKIRNNIFLTRVWWG